MCNCADMNMKVSAAVVVRVSIFGTFIATTIILLVPDIQSKNLLFNQQQSTRYKGSGFHLLTSLYFDVCKFLINCLDASLFRSLMKWLNQQLDSWTEEWRGMQCYATNECKWLRQAKYEWRKWKEAKWMEEWMYAWTGGWRDGWLDGWMDEWKTEGKN